MLIKGRELYLWLKGGNIWKNSNEVIIWRLNIIDRCLAILSHKIKINIKDDITEIIEPNLAIKFQPA